MKLSQEFILTESGILEDTVIVCFPLLTLLTQDRAQIAHWFYHWRYHLRDQVQRALTDIGYGNQRKKNHIRNLPPDRQEKHVPYFRMLMNQRVGRSDGYP